MKASATKAKATTKATTKAATKATVKASATKAKAASPKAATKATMKASATKAKAASPKAATKAETAGSRKSKKKLDPSKLELTDIVMAAASEHKPIDPILIDLSDISSVADWFFVASADNSRQMGAIAEKIIRRAREHGFRCLGHEGLNSDQWILVDLGDVVVHIFSVESRALYDFENIWKESSNHLQPPIKEGGKSKGKANGKSKVKG